MYTEMIFPFLSPQGPAIACKEPPCSVCFLWQVAKMEGDEEGML